MIAFVRKKAFVIVISVLIRTGEAMPTLYLFRYQIVEISIAKLFYFVESEIHVIAVLRNMYIHNDPSERNSTRN